MLCIKVLSSDRTLRASMHNYIVHSHRSDAVFSAFGARMRVLSPHCNGITTTAIVI